MNRLRNLANKSFERARELVYYFFGWESYQIKLNNLLNQYSNYNKDYIVNRISSLDYYKYLLDFVKELSYSIKNIDDPVLRDEYTRFLNRINNEKNNIYIEEKERQYKRINLGNLSGKINDDNYYRMIDLLELELNNDIKDIDDVYIKDRYFRLLTIIEEEKVRINNKNAELTEINDYNLLTNDYKSLREQYSNNSINDDMYKASLVRLLNFLIEEINSIKFTRPLYQNLINEITSEIKNVNNILETKHNEEVKEQYNKFVDSMRPFKKVIGVNVAQRININNLPTTPYFQLSIRENLTRYLNDLLASTGVYENPNNSFVINIQYKLYKSSKEYFTPLSYSTHGFKIKGGEKLTKDELDRQISEVEQQYDVDRVDIVGIFIIVTDYLFNVEDIRELKAFGGSYNKKFHEECSRSTSNSSLCIYETFINIRPYSMFRNNNKEIIRTLLNFNKSKDRKKHLLTLLEQEEPEIQKAVKEGNIFIALPLLCKKYITEVNVYDYDSTNCYQINKKGEIKIVYKWDVIPRNLIIRNINKEVKLLYKQKEEYDKNGWNSYEIDQKIDKLMGQLSKAKNNTSVEDQDILYTMLEQHCSPYVFHGIPPRYKKDYEKKYILKHRTRPNEDYFINCFYDIETYRRRKIEYISEEIVDNDEIYENIPYLLVYKIGYNGKCEVLYGEDCIDRFVNIIYNMIDKSYFRKGRPKDKITFYRFIAHNASKFDMTYIHYKLKRINVTSNTVQKNKSVKKMKIGNIEFIDSACIYQEKLRNLATAYLGDTSKDYFPYNFASKDKLYYKGKLPEREYWENEIGKGGKIINHYDEYLKINPEAYKNEWDFKEESINYCIKDVEILSRIMKMHYESCVSDEYNVSTAFTTSGLSLSMWLQSLPKDFIIRAPPDDIVEKCRKDYYGGLCGNNIIKPLLKGNEKVWYIDINSSYPASMLKNIPTRYLITDNFEEPRRMTEFIDHYRYSVKVKYVNHHPNLIPSLPVRDKSGKLCQPLDQTDEWRGRWGIQLNKAIRDGAEIDVISREIWEAGPIFKDFIEKKYQIRMNEKIKQKQYKEGTPEWCACEVKIRFMKNVMNNLYGKFAQKICKQTALLTYGEYRYLEKRNTVHDIKLEYLEDLDMYWINYRDSMKDAKNIGNFVHIASYISAVSQCRLCDMMSVIGYDKICYWDTDSIMYISEKSPDLDERFKELGLINNDILGKWKSEVPEGIVELITLGPKMYYYKRGNGDIVFKLKGIPNGLILEKGEDGSFRGVIDFNKMINGEKVEYIIPRLWVRDKTMVYHYNNVIRTIRSQLGKRNFKDDVSLPATPIERLYNNELTLQEIPTIKIPDDEEVLKTVNEVLTKLRANIPQETPTNRTDRINKFIKNLRSQLL